MNKNDLDFIIFVGPAKTGTTWLYEFARAHPQLGLPKGAKEVEFFNKNYDKGLEWYRDLFNYGDISCDFSPSYFTSDLAKLRIKESFPHCKIVITLREPVKRCISHYQHFLKLGHEANQNPEIALSSNPFYAANSFYSRYLQEWITLFGVENILILPIEQLKEEPITNTKRLTSFLNIDEINVDSLLNKKVNVKGTPRSYSVAKLTTNIRKRLNLIGLHSVVEVFKKLGVKQLIYSGGRNEVIVKEKTYEQLQKLFKNEKILLKDYIKPTAIYNKYYKN